MNTILFLWDLAVVYTPDRPEQPIRVDAGDDYYRRTDEDSDYYRRPDEDADYHLRSVT